MSSALGLLGRPGRAFALLCSGLLWLSPATAYEQRLFGIPASTPDDSGNPIVLDASLAVPEVGTPPFPALILNHGFGGSRTSDGGTARRLTEAGYMVLRWSQRGFGATGGEIDLMGEKERQDVLDAVNWLNDPANVPEIWVDHIGQVGASYGAGHGMALASMDHPAVRAIAPLAGWSDFYEAMAPNDVPKIVITAATWALAVPTSKLSEEFHRIIVNLTTGVQMGYAREQLQLRSEINRLDNIRTPLYLVNGWNDSYFSAEEWTRIAPTLDANGVPLWIYLGGIGHPPAEPETGEREALGIIYERIIPFFDHYVKGEDNGFENTPRIDVSNTFWGPDPVWDGTTMQVDEISPDGALFGTPLRMNLCLGLPGSNGSIQPGPCPLEAPITLSNTWTTTHPGGEYLANYFAGPFVTDVSGEELPEGRTPTPADTAVFESAPLPSDIQLTGTPIFGIEVLSQSVGAPDDGPGPFQSFQLDPLVWEVAPDESRRLITRGAYSEDLDAPLGPHLAEIDAFGFSYVFRKDHRIRIELSTNDFPYLRPASNAFEVSLLPGSYVDFPGAQKLSAPQPLVPDPLDLDGDGVQEPDDNCPFVANPDQADDGGLDTTVPDGIGNACQCGDVTGNGVVNGQDAGPIRRHGIGATNNPTYLEPGNCDVTGNDSCNGQDANAIRRAALELFSPNFGQNCHNATGAPIPPDL